MVEDFASSNIRMDIQPRLEEPASWMIGRPDLHATRTTPSVKVRLTEVSILQWTLFTRLRDNILCVVPACGRSSPVPYGERQDRALVSLEVAWVAGSEATLLLDNP